MEIKITEERKENPEEDEYNRYNSPEWKQRMLYLIKQLQENTRMRTIK